jgi:dihydroorotate dehydrogenase electron transfer subunit
MSQSGPYLEPATLVRREFLPPGFWYLTLRAPQIAAAAKSAQFVALDMPGAFMVRLPLGIYTVQDGTFSLLFQEWGERTRRLASLPEGATVSCIGPLGNSFRLPEERTSRATIVAGGLGVAAMWLLARELRDAGIETTILLGARSANLLVGMRELQTFGFPIEVCTDDGSHGFRGTVIQRLHALAPPGVLYGCGPPAMLRALCAYANDRGVTCEVSLEETFGCSLGTCWGCVVPVRRGCPQGTGYPRAESETRSFDFARVCADGTVFRAADLAWQT